MTDSGASRSQQNFSYDPYGNVWSGVTGSFPVNAGTPASDVYNSANQLTTASYDGVGNQTSLPAYCSNCLAYDGENRLVSYNGPSPASYSYDANGARVVKKTSSATTVYIYDAFGALAAEYSSNATPASVACDRCYLSTDQVGSTRMVTDASGNVVSFHDYLAFGGELDAGYAGRTNPWGSTADNVSEKFTGQERDTESGLDYFNARYFAAALGRFTSPDPGNAGADLMSPQSWNGYSYVANNPMIYTDPNGMDFQGFVSGLGNFFTNLGSAFNTYFNPPCGVAFCSTTTEFGYIGTVGAAVPGLSDGGGGGGNGGGGTSGGGGGGGGTQPAPSKPGSQPVEPPKYVIQANQGTLVLEKVLPKACTTSGTYHYSTGMNGNRDYTMAGQGPLPPGNYTLHPYEISPAGFFRKYLDPRDWGDFRVPLHPDPGTNTYRRSGFFLHGGYLRHGSEGCLKVEGSNQNNLFQQLQGAADPVPVQVTVP